MPHLAPLNRRRRLLLHGAFVAALVAATAFTARTVQEPHLALGFDVSRDGVVAHVAPGSAAQRAGLQEGDVLRAEERDEYQAWLAAPVGPLVLHVARDGAAGVVRFLSLPAEGVGGRLAAVPLYRWALLAVGLVALLIGWGVVRLNPDAPGVVPFALWSASTLLLFAAPTQSAAWSAELDALSVSWRIGAEALFQGFALHWLLLFPRRLASRRQIAGVYALVWGVSVATALAVYTEGTAFLYDGHPANVLLNAKAAAVAVAALALALVQLARAPSRRGARQAAWVLLAVVAYAAVDLVLWTLPDLLPYDVPLSTPVLDALVSAAYLVIPAGIAVAVVRERLFGIERAVIRGLAYALVLGALAAGYLVAAAGAAYALDDYGSGRLPVGWGVLLALTAALALQPLLGRAQRVVERVFDRRGQRHRAALDRFEHAAEGALRPADLERALGAAVADGLGAACRLDPAVQAAVTARPGGLALDGEAAHVVLDEGADPHFPLRLPLRTARGAFGTACVGPRPGGQPFTDDDLAFLRALARRFAGAAERLRLREEVAARELDVARTRLRIAADLHDDVGAGLSSIALLADLAAEPDDGARARPHLDAIGRSAREMVDAMRDIVWSIDPASDGAGALAARIRDAADGLLGAVPHALHLPPDEALDGLGPDARRHLLLLLKEALHNAVRHARATRVEVRLAAEAGGLVLTVADDGAGFDPAAVRAGTGLRSLRERAARLGGTLAVESAPGRGTTVRLVVPERRERVGRRGAAAAYDPASPTAR